MKANVLVSHLQMDEGRFVKRDIVDYPPDRIRQLGSSVEAIKKVPEPILKEKPAKVTEEVPEATMAAPSTSARRTRKKG